MNRIAAVPRSSEISHETGITRTYRTVVYELLMTGAVFLYLIDEQFPTLLSRSALTHRHIQNSLCGQMTAGAKPSSE
jgi:hypothetical protein